jgi:outer membrane protein assembly factor BamB
VRTPQLATRSVKVLAVPRLLTRVIAVVWPRRGRAWSRALAVAAVSMLLALGLFAAPVGAVTVSITLKPATGPPTSAVTVTGTGFGATETVAVDFSAAQVATATTSPAGTFSAVFTVPKPTLPGNYPVTATGQTSGRSATHNFLVRTDWSQFHFDAAHSGFNPYENVIGPSNVSGLKTAWTAAPGIGSVGTSPAVAGGVVYVGSASTFKLYAFSAAGTTGCSGTPKTCQPLWTAATGGIALSSPAVAGGVVYFPSADGHFYAFSAAGTTGCSGTPKTCQPLWTAAIASVGQGFSSPAVAGGVVYVNAATTLYAFSATGTTGCSGTPKVCTPLWTATGAGGVSPPAVAGGVVYAGVGDGNLYAFSVADTTGCSGTPPNRTCTPLWIGNTSGGDIGAPPAVVGGVVYAGSGNTGKLYAFSAAAGSTHCSGTPKTCTPLWTAAGAGGVSSPAVANGVVYNGAAGKVYGFSAGGTTGCSGTPPNRTCTPLWTAATGGNTTYSSPAVANGKVYEGEWDAPSLAVFGQ